MHIYPYKPGSESAKALAQALNIKRAKHHGKPLRTDVLINWGSSEITRAISSRVVLNSPESVGNASNKLQAFKLMEGRVSHVPFTESIVEAQKWLAEGFSVVRRAILNGHSGNGISIHEPDGDVEDLKGAKLYTKYIKKDQEYRIHVFQGNVIFQQRKARKKDVPDDEVNWKVRNLAGGFIFANVDVVAPDAVRNQAVAAVQCLGLDFGAVDVLWTHAGEAYVCEVNTACGLSGTTLTKYSEAFVTFLQQFK